MNDKKWEQYQQRVDDLHKKYKKRRWLARLIWLAYFVPTTALILWLVGLPFSIPVAVFNLMMSFVVLSQNIKSNLRIEAEQERLLMDEAPMGKIRY